MIYTTDMLVNKFNAYTNPKAKIKRMCNNNELLHICQGLYDDNLRPSLFRLHAYIYGPSYVSFRFALSYYNLIPEFNLNVSCATYGKNKRKDYDTSIGYIYYQDVPKQVYPYGVKTINMNGYVYRMATPEKALCDYLYSDNYKLESESDFKDYLFEDLRIDIEEFENLDFEFIVKIAPLYKRKNLDYLVNYIIKEGLYAVL